MYEERASFREVVNLSPPQALDRAEYFLVEQGYIVVNRTATTLTVEREATEGTAAQVEAPKLVVMAVPQPHGGVRIKVRGNDREGMRERQARWTEWEAALPKRLPPPKVRTKVVKVGESRRGLSRFSRTTAVLVASLLALLVIVGVVGLAISGLSGPLDATEVVQRLEEEGMPIGETKAYTAENDPNELLGRPGQYTSKVIFEDTRLGRDRSVSGFDVQNGGSVEVFESEDDAFRRAEYVEAIAQSLGPLNEYAFREGTVLLRLSHRLTPQQADEYEAALQESL